MDGLNNTLLQSRCIFPTFLCQKTKEGLERKAWWKIVGLLFCCMLDWCCLLTFLQHAFMVTQLFDNDMEQGRDGLCFLREPSHLDNFIMKNLSVKLLNLVRPQLKQTSQIKTVILWPLSITINWLVQAKLLF